MHEMNEDSAELASFRTILLRFIFEPPVLCRQEGLGGLRLHTCIVRQVNRAKCTPRCSTAAGPALRLPSGRGGGRTGLGPHTARRDAHSTPHYQTRHTLCQGGSQGGCRVHVHEIDRAWRGTGNHLPWRQAAIVAREGGTALHLQTPISIYRRLLPAFPRPSWLRLYTTNKRMQAAMGTSWESIENLYRIYTYRYIHTYIYMGSYREREGEGGRERE